MSFKNEIIPVVPEEIKEAARNGRLTVFVGAGVSRIMGCKSWEELAYDCLKHTKRVCGYSYAQYDALCRYAPRKILTVCLDSLKEAKSKYLFEDALGFDEYKSAQYPLYEKLYDWKISYVTTNYDYGFKNAIRKIFLKQESVEEVKSDSSRSLSESDLDKMVKACIVYDVDEIMQSNLDQGKVVCLHGSLDDPDSLIVTLSDYICRYSSDSPQVCKFKKFVNWLFDAQTVLFLGYSLEESEILEYIVGKAHKNTHYVLLPLLSSQECLAPFEKKYYQSIGIKPIFYNIDEKGYEQLFDVVSAWERELGKIARERHYYEKEEIVRNAIAAKDVNNEDLHNLLKNDQYRWSFFKEIKDSDWFNSLQTRGYFLPDKVRSICDGREGNPYWPVLDYLIKISEQIKDGKNLEYAKELLLIIKDVSEYVNDEGEHIDNYFVYDRFITILCNLSNESIHEFIKEQTVDFNQWVRTWLSTSVDTSVVTADISGKLFYKFMCENPTNEDIAIAEIIGRNLLKVDINPLDESEKRYSKKESKAKIVADEHWVVDSLIKKGGLKKFGQHCSLAFISEIVNTIRELLQLESFNQFVDINVKGKWYRVSVSRLTEDYRIKQGVYDVAINRLPDEGAGDASSRVETLNAGKPIANFQLGKIEGSKMFVAQIVKHCKAAGLETVDEPQLNSLYDGLQDDHSYIWLKSIRAGAQYYSDEALTVLSVGLRGLLKGKLAAKVDVSEILKIMLSDEYRFPLMKRFVLFVAANDCETYWGFARKIIENTYGLFSSLEYESELYDLLNSNVDFFSKSPEREFIETAIMQVRDGINQEKWAKAITHTRARFFQALSANEYFRKKMEEVCQEGDVLVADVEKPRDSASVCWTGNGTSFYDEQWFLEHSGADIVGMFASLKDENRFSPEQRTVEATADVFKDAVKKNPERFVNGIEAFENAKFICVNHFLSGLQDAWSEKKTFDWANVLKFIKAYMLADYFKNNEKDFGYDMAAHRQWVVSAAARLISSGCRDENAAINETNFDVVEDVFGCLLATRYGDEPVKNDIQEAINTSYGSVIEAYIMFSLRRARVKDANKEDRGFRVDIYDSLLQKLVPEAYTFLGRYLINFVYLDKEWAMRKIEELKGADLKGKLWKGFFQGYVWGGGVYKVLYEPMQWHYRKAIESRHDYDSVQKQIIEHAVLEYLRADDDKPIADKDHLFRFVLDANEYDKWKMVASSLWSRSRECLEKIEQDDAEVEFLKRGLIRVKDFWQWCFKKKNARKRLGDQYEDFLSDISLLTCIFDRIENELFKQLIEIAPHVEKFYHASHFMEYLNHMAISTQQEGQWVGKIFREMLTSSLPTYKQEIIVSLVEKIYSTGAKDIANDICNKYGKSGVQFLRDL